MAEQGAAAGGQKAGWVKTIMGTIGGVLGGAVAMYATTLVNKAIEPPRPVANFRVDAEDGTHVRFQNLSNGGQGWWDFGDGSQLEPAVANVPFITHAYTHPGAYSVKLTLRNLLGETNERATSVTVEEPVGATPPHVASLQAIPLSAGSYAPATFKLTSQVQNARLVVWDIGDDRPLEVVTDPPAASERLVTFARPGGYVVKLAAFNGTQFEQKTEVVTVMEPPNDTITVIVTATDLGHRVQTRLQQINFGLVYPADRTENTLPIGGIARARPGFTIKDLTVQGPSGLELALGNRTSLELDLRTLGVKNASGLTLGLSEDRKTLVLTGELERPAGAGQDPDAQPGVLLTVHTTEVREDLQARVATPVTTTLAVPYGGINSSSLLALPPVPANKSRVERSLKVEVREADKVLWETESLLPQQVALTLNGRPCVLTATRVNDQVHFDLRESPLGPARVRP